MNSPTPDTSALVPSRGFTLYDVLLTVKRHSRRVAVATVSAGAIAFGASMFMTPMYTARVTFLPPSQSDSAAGMLMGGLSGLASLAGGLGMKSSDEQWVGMLRSETVEDAMVRRFDLMKRYDAKFHFVARKRLEARTSVTLGKDGLVKVEVDDADPATAAQMASAYVEELQKLSDTLAITDASKRRQFFEGQLKQANDALVKAQVALEKGGISESLLKASPEAAVDVVGQLKAQETAAEIKMNVLRGRVTTSSPEWRDAVQELAAVRAQLAAASASSFREASASGPAASQGGADYIRRYRDFKYAETLFEMMARQYELAKLDEAKQGAFIQIVDHPTVPEWKSSPKRALIALVMAVVAFLVTLGHLLVRASLATARRNSPEVASTLEQLRAVRWFR